MHFISHEKLNTRKSQWKKDLTQQYYNSAEINKAEKKTGFTFCISL